MALAVQRVGETGGLEGKPLQLIFEDTQGTVALGVHAVGKLLRGGVHAFAGEFHSVVADAIVDHVERSGRPFVCASATLDAITARRLRRVFRIAPAQSYGWRIYADFLIAEGFKRVVTLIEENIYWKAGADIIESQLNKTGVPFTRLRFESGMTASHLVRQLTAMRLQSTAPNILLLLIAYPDPLRSVIQALHSNHLVPPILFLGDPAGRSIFPDWWDVAGDHAVQISFLAYARPRTLAPEGVWVAEKFEERFGRQPTFVALEGYDSVIALARAFEASRSTDPTEVCEALRHVEIAGTRGTLRFSTEPTGTVHQQWAWPPVCVVEYRQPRQAFSDADLLWGDGKGVQGLVD